MTDEIKKVKLEVVEDGGVARKVSIPKPGPFCLDDFKSEHAPAHAGVETLQTALPHHRLKDAKDFVRLHPDEATHWSPELCFVSVPVKGVSRDVLHLIVEKLAMRYLPSARIERFRLALASKPYDVFFLAHIPTQNTDNTWVASNLIACEQAKTHWVQVTSRRAGGCRCVQGDHGQRPRCVSRTQVAAAINQRPDRRHVRRMQDHRGRPSGTAAVDWCQAADVVSGTFTRIVVGDFEYEVAPGDMPNVLCLVLYVLDENLHHVQTIRLWRGEFGSTPPIDFDDDTLFCAYSAWAELTCFLTLGWTFPKHVFDLHTAYLATSNILLPHNPEDEDEERKRKKPRKRLSGCVPQPTASKVGSSSTRRRWRRISATGSGRSTAASLFWSIARRTSRKTVELLRAQVRGRPGIPAVSVKHVLHWSNYSAKAIALIQARGMPIDMQLWNLVQDNKAAVVDSLLRRFDPSYGSNDPIYSPEGEWSYARFEQWLDPQRRHRMAKAAKRTARYRQRRLQADGARPRGAKAARASG